ncbi:MAG: cation transporter [Clostridiales bacterium]|nr:cation transporter [Clostridiales bacterium]
MSKFFNIFIKNADDVCDPKVRSAYGTFTSVVGIIFNLLLFGAKLLAGLISGSVAIIADALNNFGDASSSVISFIGFKLSVRPADKEHPYGHGRYEYVSAFIVTILIMVIGVELFKSGVEKIINPSQVNFTTVVAIILAVSIIAKILLSILNGVASKKINSTALKATSHDARNDAISTTAVLISLILSKFVSFPLDGIMAVLVAVFIMISALGLLKDTLASLLGKPPEKEKVDFIRKKLMSYDGVLGIHDLIVHDYGVGRQFASVHVEMAAEGDVILSHELIDSIEKSFLDEDGVEIVIHFDPVSTTNPIALEIRDYLACNVKKISPELSVHDVRIVDGKYRNIVIFDCVMPYNFDMSEVKLREELDCLVKETYPKFDTVVTIDKNYL